MEIIVRVIIAVALVFIVSLFIGDKRENIEEQSKVVSYLNKIDIDSVAEASVYNEAPNYRVLSETIREVTAYNVGDRSQCYGNPCISASGDNLCEALNRGERHCAANFVPLGTKLYIDFIGVCVVSDRMNKRYRNRVDIAMSLHEKSRARKFGKQKLLVSILK